MTKPRYTVIIQWSEEDQAYVVSLPEWGPYCKTHGSTYEEAAKNAHEVLDLLLEHERTPDSLAVPQPKLFHFPGADVVYLPDSEVANATFDAGSVKSRQPA
jgi:predicted RNase H-like HicB family nuclease